ncbi:MAG: acetyl-CoA carboxylase, carboxyltransferase subunit beta [Chthoniobacterales bacterium]|nr:acetyl-CoA carboxylase, carboxyltransferase subunit beta [Chthoniobacterales bacterium]
MAIFKKPVLSVFSGRRRDVPEGLWTKCLGCGELVHNLALEENLQVCPKCGYHFTIGAWERIQLLVDEGSFEEMDEGMVSVDPLKFHGVASYEDKLRSYREKTGLRDAVISGVGRIGGYEVALAVMDFRFLAASLGSVVGEKITKVIERATAERRGVVIISASGGARMYESMLSLMQMAKTSGALALHSQARLPYISVLTNPTMAGVMASYATLGDVILAEPGAMVGFAGPRVIRETTHQELPEGFQTAEFLEKHGLIDHIVPRREMRSFLIRLLSYLMPKRMV